MTKTGKRKVYVSIGSNVDKERNVVSCVKMLRETFGELTLSPVYESAAVGFEGGDFYNMVASFETERSPRNVADVLRVIEKRHGRVRSKDRFESRTLDLDQVLYGDLVIRENGVQVPRDDVVRYAFVLRPLADIAGGETHPVLEKTYARLWEDLSRGAPALKKVSLKGIQD